MSSQYEVDLCAKFNVAAMLVLSILFFLCLVEGRKAEEKSKLFEASRFDQAMESAASIDGKYGNSDIEAKKILLEWQRAVKDTSGEVVIYNGSTAKVLLTTFEKTYVYSWGGDYQTRHPYWILWAETPNGRLFSVKFDPETNELYELDTEVTRSAVIRAAIKAGKVVKEESFIRLHGLNA